MAGRKRLTDAVSRRLSRAGSRGSKSTKPSPYSYRQLMSEKSFLKVAQRASRVQGFSLLSVDYLADDTGIELRYLVNSVERPGVKYNVVLRIDNLAPSSIVSHTTNQVAALLRMSGIKVYCSCPAFYTGVISIRRSTRITQRLSWGYGIRMFGILICVGLFASMFMHVFR